MTNNDQIPVKLKKRDRKVYSQTQLEEILEWYLNEEMSEVNWLSDEEYAKAIGQLGMQVTGIFDFLKVDEKLPVRYMYGMGNYIPSAISEIVKLAEDFGLRVRGLDKPISLELVRNGKRFVVFENKEEE